MKKTNKTSKLERSEDDLTSKNVNVLFPRNYAEEVIRRAEGCSYLTDQDVQRIINTYRP